MHFLIGLGVLAGLGWFAFGQRRTRLSVALNMNSDVVAAGIWKFLWQLAAVILLLAVVYAVGYAVFMGLLFLYATGNLPMLIGVPIIGIPLIKSARWLWRAAGAPARRREFRDFWINNDFSYDGKPRINAHGIRYPLGPVHPNDDEIMQVVERAFQGAESKDKVEKIKRICVGMLHHPEYRLETNANSMKIALRKYLQRKAVAAFDAAREWERKVAWEAAQKRAEFAEAGGEPVDLTTAQQHLNRAADMLQAARGTEAEDTCRKNHAEKLAALLAAKSAA